MNAITPTGFNFDFDKPPTPPVAGLPTKDDQLPGGPFKSVTSVDSLETTEQPASLSPAAVADDSAVDILETDAVLVEGILDTEMEVQPVGTAQAEVGPEDGAQDADGVADGINLSVVGSTETTEDAAEDVETSDTEASADDTESEVSTEVQEAIESTPVLGTVEITPFSDNDAKHLEQLEMTLAGDANADVEHHQHEEAAMPDSATTPAKVRKPAPTRPTRLLGSPGANKDYQIAAGSFVYKLSFEDDSFVVEPAEIPVPEARTVSFGARAKCMETHFDLLPGMVASEWTAIQYEGHNQKTGKVVKKAALVRLSDLRNADGTALAPHTARVPRADKAPKAPKAPKTVAEHSGSHHLGRPKGSRNKSTLDREEHGLTPVVASGAADHAVAKLDAVPSGVLTAHLPAVSLQEIPELLGAFEDIQQSLAEVAAANIKMTQALQRTIQVTLGSHVAK